MLIEENDSGFHIPSIALSLDDWFSSQKESQDLEIIFASLLDSLKGMTGKV
jgi:hypothetical protein